MPAESSSGGGSGGGRSPRGSGAEYELRLKDMVTSPLAKIQQGVQTFTKRFKQFTAPLAGAFGQIFEVGARGGALGVAIASGQKLVEAVTGSVKEWAFGAEAFNKRLEDTVAQVKRIRTDAAAAAASMREWFGATTDPGEKARLLTEEMRRQNAVVDDLTRKSAQTQRDINNPPSRLSGRHDESLANAKKTKEELEAQRREVQLGIAKLIEERNRLLKPSTDPGFLGPVRRMREGIENDLMFGHLSGVARQIAEMKRHMTDPAAIAELDVTRLNAEYVEHTKKIRDAANALTAYADASVLAREQSGLTADEIALDNARRAGVGQETFERERRRILGGPGGMLGAGILQGLTGVPQIGAQLAQALSAVKGEASRGAFAAPSAVASQMFGGAAGKEIAEKVGRVAEGQGALPERIGQSVANYLRVR